MPPQYIGGEDIGMWYPADCGQAYNDRLASSNFVQVGGDTMPLAATTTTSPVIVLILMGLMILWLT